MQDCLWGKSSVACADTDRNSPYMHVMFSVLESQQAEYRSVHSIDQKYASYPWERIMMECRDTAQHMDRYAHAVTQSV